MYDSTDIALITVCTDDFIEGSLVTLGSFIRHNQWFCGDIIVLHDGLSKSSIDRLVLLFESIKFRLIEKKLFLAVEQLNKTFPRLGKKRARFYSLNCFAMMDYNQIIFCDSDLLFCGDVRGMLKPKTALVACPDASYFRGNSRNRVTFVETKGKGIRETFNAGLMVINTPLVDGDVFNTLLSYLDERVWQYVKTEHTDQFVLNKYFEGNVTQIPCRYNFLLGFSELFTKQSGVLPQEALVLHFNGSLKPWRAELPLKKLECIDDDMLWAINEWKTEAKRLNVSL